MKTNIKSVIFVCLGNICRSPLAEGIGKKLAKDLGLDLIISSAGTGPWHVGEPPCSDSIKVARGNGIDISFQRAKQISKNDFDTYDLVIVMDRKNREDLDARGLFGSRQIGDFGLDSADIPDPYFFDGFEGFDKVFSMIETGVLNLFTEIKDKKLEV